MGSTAIRRYLSRTRRETARPPRSDRSFTFERHLSKALGGTGYADVWKRNFFAWEYEGPHNISDSSGATISNVAVLVATNLL
jgi:hypothetical protein